eukprot:SAG31_NODE_36928_length_309_cov_0.719048_1_plen_28_part_10
MRQPRWAAEGGAPWMGGASEQAGVGDTR